MTTTTDAPTTGTPVIGAGVTRVDGPLKVTGAVPYADDLAPRDALVGVLVGATIASGEISLVDTSDALAAPGVVAVLSHHDAPAVVRPNEASADERAPLPPFQDATVRFHGDYVAMVVAQTREEALHAATLLHVTYDVAEPVVDLNDPRAAREEDDPAGADSLRGDLERGLAEADVVVEADYVTGDNTNNPLGLFSACAEWDGDVPATCGRPPSGRSTPPTASPRRGASRARTSGSSVPTSAAASAPACGRGPTSTRRRWPRRSSASPCAWC